MNPLLTLLAGLVTGAIGVRMATSAKVPAKLQDAAGAGAAAARDGFSAARSGMRDAAAAGLGSIEQASARLRTKLRETGNEPVQPVDDTPAAAMPVATADPASKQSRPPRSSRAAVPGAAARPAARRRQERAEGRGADEA